jgi:hypothetical protein
MLLGESDAAARRACGDDVQADDELEEIRAYPRAAAFGYMEPLGYLEPKAVSRTAYIGTWLKIVLPIGYIRGIGCRLH